MSNEIMDNDIDWGSYNILMTHTETKQIEGGDLGPPGVLITFSCYTFTPQQRRRRLGLNDNTFPAIPSHIPRRLLSLSYLLLCVALSICSSSGTLYISLALGTSQAVFLIFINCFDKSGKNLHILFLVQYDIIWFVPYCDTSDETDALSLETMLSRISN